MIHKLDLEYILKYSDEKPLKYHDIKAAQIKQISSEASAAAASTSTSGLKGDYKETVVVDENEYDDIWKCVGDVSRTPEPELSARKYYNDKSIKYLKIDFDYII